MITLTFEPTNPEQAALLGQFLPQYMKAGELVVSGEPEQVKAVIEQAAEAVEEKPAKKQRKAAAPAAAAVEQAESSTAETSAPTATTAAPSAPAADVTLEQVRAKLAALSQAGKAAAVKELIAGYGVAKLTDVPKDHYASLLAAAEEIA